VSLTKAGSIGVPTISNMKSAFGNFAWGAGAGLVFALAQAIFGSGLIGALAAPVLAGSVIKGETGSVVSTIAGFMLMSQAFNGATASASTASPGVM